MPVKTIANRPDLVAYAIDLATRIKRKLLSGEISAADVSDMMIENRVLAKRQAITPVVEAINSRVLSDIKSRRPAFDPIVRKSIRQMRVTGLSGQVGLAGLWDTIKNAADTVYGAGEKAVSEIGKFVDIIGGESPVNIHVPEVDQALKDLSEKGLVRITTTIPPTQLQSIFGLPPWTIPAALGVILFLLLRRR